MVPVLNVVVDARVGVAAARVEDTGLRGDR